MNMYCVISEGESRHKARCKEVYNSLILTLALRMPYLWVLQNQCPIFNVSQYEMLFQKGCGDVFSAELLYFHFECLSRSLRVLNLDFVVRINNVPVVTNSVMFMSCLCQRFSEYPLDINTALVYTNHTLSIVARENNVCVYGSLPSQLPHNCDPLS